MVVFRFFEKLRYSRALVSHIFVFVYIREFGYYILFGACRNEEK